MKTLKFIWNRLRGSRLFYCGAMTAVMISAALTLLTPYLIKVLIDYIFGDRLSEAPVFVAQIIGRFGGPGYFRNHLWICGLAVVVPTLINGLVMFCRGVLSSRASERIAKRLRDDLFSHIQRLPYATLVKIKTGDYIQRCTSDVELIRRFLESQFVEAGRTVVLIIGILLVMLSQNVRFTLVATPILPLVFICSLLFFHLVRGAFRKTDEAEGRMMAVLQENLTGVKVVRAFARQRYEIDKFEASSVEFRDLDLGLGRLVSYFWSISDFFCMLQTGIIIIVGVIWAVRGDVSLGTVLLFISYEAQLLWPIRELAQILSDMGKMSISVARLEEILVTPAEDMREHGEKPCITGNVVFDRVSFVYDDAKEQDGTAKQAGREKVAKKDKLASKRVGQAAEKDGQALEIAGHASPLSTEEVLREVSFSVERGQTVAIMGPTGSGKTSLVNLLAALYDYTAGSIRLDGVELKTIQKEWLRQNVGIVEQEVFLFSRTIEENISLAQKQATPQEVREAAHISKIHQDIEQFPLGYKTLVGERGMTLSGGQKQRTAIARTILGKYPILVFDDSLSAVDTETDAAIRGALKGRRKDVTTFIVAHRITTLYDADLILVFDRGRVVQSGTHQELIVQTGLYQRIWDMQKNLEDRLPGGDADDTDGENIKIQDKGIVLQ